MADYLAEINRAIVSFQFIEECLRIYLGYAYELLQLRVGDALPVRLARKDIEHWSMGRLIREFAKFNDNSGLVEGMLKLASLRNEVAHRGLLLTVEQTQDKQHMEQQAERALRIADGANGCFHELFAEIGKLSERLTALRGPGSPAPSKDKPASRET